MPMRFIDTVNGKLDFDPLTYASVYWRGEWVDTFFEIALKTNYINVYNAYVKLNNELDHA